MAQPVFNGIAAGLLSTSDLSALTIINPKAPPYNAKFDGITDDAAALQSAFNAAGSTSAVVLPSGTALVGTPLTLPSNNMVIMGAGPQTVLKAKVAGNGIIYDTGSRTGTLIRDITFDGGNLAASLLTVNGGNNHNTVVERCIFQNVNGNVPAVLIGGQSAPTGGSKISPTSSRGVRIVNCLFQNNATQTRESLLVDACQDSLVSGCVFYGNSCKVTGLLGIWAYCYHVSVTDCVFTGNTWTGTGGAGFEIYTEESTHVSIDGCSFDANTGPGSWGAIIIMNTADVSVTNCRFDGYATNVVTSHDWATDPDGLTVIWANSDAIKLEGNTFYNCTQIRFPQDAGGSYNTALGTIDIIGNHFIQTRDTAISIGGNGVAQSVGPLNIASNTVEAGAYTGTAIGVYSGATATLQGNWVGDSSGASSAGIQIDSSGSSNSVYAFDNISLNHVAAYKQTGGATFVRAANNVGLNPIGSVTVTTTSHAWTNSTGVSVTIYVTQSGNYTGTTTITLSGGSAVTVSDAVGPVSYRVPPGATLTWGVGGTVTADPTLTGLGD